MTDSETLQSAAWLLEREFAAEVRVLAAAEAPDDVASLPAARRALRARWALQCVRHRESVAHQQRF